MALDKLVDSTKLDACLDAEADAIRAKTGDSNDLTFDFANNKGFADAIAAIPSGGGGEKTLTKLGEATISPNVTKVEITATDDMKSCETLFLYISATLSASDWLYPYVNDSSNSYLPTKQTTHIWRVPVMLSPSASVNEGTISRYWNIVGTQGTGASASGNSFSTFSKIGVKTYSSGTKFQSGTIEVWGYV